MKKYLKFILVPIGFLIFIGALALLNNQLKHLSYHDIVNALHAIPAYKIALAAALSLLYYLILGGYDIVSFKYINAKAPLKPKDIFFTCFISNVMGNNTGYSMLFGGSIRYRLYSMYKVSMLDVTKVLFFSAATIWLGLLAIGGLVFVASPMTIPGIPVSTKTIGIFFLAILLAYIALSAFNSKPRTFFKRTISFPNIKIVAAQILLATADWIIASLTLYTLMPAGVIPYFTLLKVFLVAQLLGIISQVPGGMGVFEASIALLLPSAMENPAIIGGLLAYRAIFYFFPLTIALVLFGASEIMRSVKQVGAAAKIFGRTVSSAIVQVLAISTFFAGAIAIFSNSTPFQSEEIQTVVSLMPSWFKDLSHFLLSVTAASLLFVSRAIQLRIKSSYWWALGLTTLAIALILVIGEPPLVLALFIILFIALAFSKKYFYRNISILDSSFSAWWFSAIAGVFVLAVWVGFFINQQDIFSWIKLDVFYQNMLSDSDAARFLRATLGLIIIFVVVASEQIIKNYFKKEVPFTARDIAAIVDSASYTYAYEALEPGKEFVVNDEKNSFIMYASQGSTQIALSDPVGPSGFKSEILWKFKELADKKSVKPVFIAIDHKYRQIYSDVGLDIFHIGQEAKILLKNFGKNISADSFFSSLTESVEKHGFVYDVIEAKDFEKHKDEYDAIDAQWKKTSGYIERNFVPGKYDPRYMKDFNFSVLKKDGKICAFSVLLAAKNKHEASSGIARYLYPNSDIFPYLVYKNILWAKENGYKWFDLGLTYVHSEEFDNEFIRHFAKLYMFAEHFNEDLTRLREFKLKFKPVWHNKYIAIHPDKYIISFVKDFISLIYGRKMKGRSLGRSVSDTISGRIEFFRRFFKR